MIDEVACGEDKERYKRFRLRSFVEDNRMYEWCPAPDCEFAVESYVDLQGEPLDVACTCGATFCFDCKEEAHRPVGQTPLFQGLVLYLVNGHLESHDRESEQLKERPVSLL